MLRSSAVAAFVLALGLSAANAEEVRFFQLGSGPVGESRFPIGGLIANALSNPPGSRACDRGGPCGVPGLVAVAKSVDGVGATVDALRGRRLDAALEHADTAFWAVHGQGPFKGRPATHLRAIAMVYGDSLHLVARPGAGIRTVADLRGKRVSLGEADSALAVHGRALLTAFGVPGSQVRVTPMTAAAAAEALAGGRLDAFLVADAAPTEAVAELAQRGGATLIAIDGAAAERLNAGAPYLRAGEIPAGSYDGQPAAVPTLAVGVVLLVPAEAEPALIREVTRALWHPATGRLVNQGNPRGRLFHPDAAAATRLGIPLHPGAAAYYAEAGIPY